VDSDTENGSVLKTSTAVQSSSARRPFTNKPFVTTTSTALKVYTDDVVGIRTQIKCS